jgi:hypothetical protein
MGMMVLPVADVVGNSSAWRGESDVRFRTSDYRFDKEAVIPTGAERSEA